MAIKWRICTQNRNYKISNTGLCKSAHQRFEGKYLTPIHTKWGKMYCLCEKYYKNKYRVANLVYTAFIGEIPEGHIVFHKDGDVTNVHPSNLGVIPRGDKIFFYCQRTKKMPRTRVYNSYLFVINGKAYKSVGALIKDYPAVGTRQNVLEHANRWLMGDCARGSKWDPAGFKIKDILIYAVRFHDKNFVKKRMDYITEKYILTKKDEGCQN